MPRRYWLPVFAVVGLILAGQVHAQAVGNNAGDKTGTQKSQTKPSANPPPFPPALQYDIHRAAHALESESEKQPTYKEESRADRNVKAQEDTALWALLMIFVGVLEAGITGYGVFLVWRTLEASWATAGHAQRAADAARDTVNSMDAATQKQLRAYTGVERLAFDCSNFGAYVGPYRPKDPSVPGTTADDFLCITVKNYGQTPAFETAVYAYWTPVPSNTRPVSGSFDNSMPEVKDTANIRTIVSHFLLQRDQTHTTRVPIWDLTPVFQAQSQKCDLFIFGRVYYRDAFKKPWRTTFCFQWRPLDHSTKYEFLPHEEYNGEDSKPLPA